MIIILKLTHFVSGVEQACCEFLTRQLDSSNCLGIRKFAETHACTGLLEASTEFCSRHFKEVVNQEEFVTLSEDEVLDLTRRDDLEVCLIQDSLSKSHHSFNTFSVWYIMLVPTP